MKSYTDNYCSWQQSPETRKLFELRRRRAEQQRARRAAAKASPTSAPVKKAKETKGSDDVRCRCPS